MNRGEGSLSPFPRPRYRRERLRERRKGKDVGCIQIYIYLRRSPRGEATYPGEIEKKRNRRRGVNLLLSPLEGRSRRGAHWLYPSLIQLVCTEGTPFFLYLQMAPGREDVLGNFFTSPQVKKEERKRGDFFFLETGRKREEERSRGPSLPSSCVTGG